MMNQQMMNQQIDNDRPEDLTRRGLFVKGIYTLASLIVGTLAASVGTYLVGTPKRIDSDAWADAGEVAELHTGSPQEVTFEKSRTDGWKTRNEKATAWVVLNDQEHLTAFAPQCTHLGCAYRWEAPQQAFVCPCHGSLFRVDGQVLKGPARRPLDRYMVKIEANRLWLGPLRISRES